MWWRLIANVKFVASYLPDLLEVLFTAGPREAWSCAAILHGAVTHKPSARQVRQKAIFDAMTDAEMEALLKTDRDGVVLLEAKIARRIGSK